VLLLFEGFTDFSLLFSGGRFRTLSPQPARIQLSPAYPPLLLLGAIHIEKSQFSVWYGGRFFASYGRSFFCYQNAFFLPMSLLFSAGILALRVFSCPYLPAGPFAPSVASFFLELRCLYILYTFRVTFPLADQYLFPLLL